LEWVGFALMAVAIAAWRRARKRWIALVLVSLGVVSAALGTTLRELSEWAVYTERSRRSEAPMPED